MNYDLNLLTNWFWQHKLFINTGKTNLMCYGSQKIDLNSTLKLHTNPHCPPTCNCQYITQVTQTKYLGLTLDQKLNWESHTLQLQNKLRKLNYVLYHTSRLFTRAHLLRVYKALYEPVLRYGIIHWGHSPKKFTTPLKILQKQAIRTIAGIRRSDSSIPHFRNFDLLNLDQLYKFYSVKYAHRHFNKLGLMGAPVIGLRGREPTLARPKWLKESSRTHAAYALPTIFNSLPIEVREINFHKQFSNAVRKILIKTTANH